MIHPEKITFPITGTQLADMQRAELGRDLTPDEENMFAEIADMVNEVYEAAAHGDHGLVAEVLDAINTYPVTCPFEQHITALCRGWALLGLNSGMSVLKSAIDGLS